MLTAMRILIEDLVGEYHGECVAMDEKAYVMRFKVAEQAVAAALRLRKTLLESSWPEAILALPGCGLQPMALELQAPAKGPQLQTIIYVVSTSLAFLDHMPLLFILGLVWHMRLQRDGRLTVCNPCPWPLSTLRKRQSMTNTCICWSTPCSHARL